MTLIFLLELFIVVGVVFDIFFQYFVVYLIFRIYKMKWCTTAIAYVGDTKSICG